MVIRGPRHDSIRVRVTGGSAAANITIISRPGWSDKARRIHHSATGPEMMSEAKRHAADKAAWVQAPTLRVCPLEIEFQELGQQGFVAQGGVPAVGGEDGLVELAVGQLQPCGPLVVKVRERAALELARTVLVGGDDPRVAHGADSSAHGGATHME